MYAICKRFSFSAAHHLTGLPASHPCATNHGHNYEVEVEFQSPFLDAVGFVIDYRELDSFKAWLMETVDHKDLNQVFQFNPTAEQLAVTFWVHLTKVFNRSVISAVRVSETPKTWAEYRPELRAH